MGPVRIRSTDIPLILDVIVAPWGTFRSISYDSRVVNDALTALDTTDEATELTTLSISFYIDEQEAYKIRPYTEEMHSRYVPFGGRAPKLKRLELSRINLDWSR